jgi:hypothetical protein
MRSSFFVALVLIGCGPADDRLPGPNDGLAEHSCEHLATDTPEAITAATTEDGAADVVIELQDTPYLVTLPAAANGYASLRISTEHSYVAMFVRERGAVIDGPNFEAAFRHASCSGQIADDFRWHIDDPDDYVLTFSDEGPREVWLQAVLEESGHDDDGGAHDHDGGH